MPPRPSHKRAAASSGENTPAPEGSRKKTRFVEPSEDPVNFAEEVDAQLENPSAKRKGRVNTEGYESDSSDDGEGVVNSRKPGAAGAAGDDDEDMFMMGDKEEEKAEEEAKKSGAAGGLLGGESGSGVSSGVGAVLSLIVVHVFWGYAC